MIIMQYILHFEVAAAASAAYLDSVFITSGCFRFSGFGVSIIYIAGQLSFVISTVISVLAHVLYG